MLDAHYGYDHLPEVETNNLNRYVKLELSELKALFERNNQLVRDVQDLQQKQNELAKNTGKEKDAAKRQALIEEGRSLREQVQATEAPQTEADAALRPFLLRIPNL